MRIWGWTTAAAGLVAAVFVLGSAPARAHHSASAVYDTSRELSLSGTLVSMRDMNPHSFWKVLAKGADGQPETWDFEGVGVAALRRQGVAIRDQIRPGETYVFYYGPAWKLPHAGLLSAIEIGGRKVAFMKLTGVE